MKKMLKRFSLMVLVFYLLINFYPGLSGPNHWQPILLAAGVYFFLTLVVKPILKILLIPINILTLGMAGWLVNVILLYLLVLLLPEVSIEPFVFGPVRFNDLNIPAISLNYWGSLVVTSFLVSLTGAVLDWIFS